MCSSNSVGRALLFKVLVIDFNEESNGGILRAEPQAGDNRMRLNSLTHSFQSFEPPGLNDVISFCSYSSSVRNFSF